jgi:hypothetical protein
MQSWYIIIVNLLLGTAMTLIGFKIYKPEFRSEESEKNFYKNFTMLFKVGGIAMIAWGAFKLFSTF